MFLTDIIRGGLIEGKVGNNLENKSGDVLRVKDKLSRLDLFD